VLPPIPEKPAAPATPVAEATHPVETSARAVEVESPRAPAPPVVVVEKQDVVEPAAPAPAPVAHVASVETPAVPAPASVIEQPAPAPAVTQPQQGDLLGHVVKVANVAAPVNTPADAEAEPAEEAPRHDAAP